MGISVCEAVFGYQFTVCKDSLECGVLLTFIDLSRKGIPVMSEISVNIWNHKGFLPVEKKDPKKGWLSEQRNAGCLCMLSLCIARLFVPYYRHLETFIHRNSHILLGP